MAKSRTSSRRTTTRTVRQVYAPSRSGANTALLVGGAALAAGAAYLLLSGGTAIAAPAPPLPYQPPPPPMPQGSAPAPQAPFIPGQTSPIDNVAAQQNALNLLGFGPIAEDGRLGPATVAALRAFQASKGLPATGVADPATKSALLDAVINQ